MAVLAVPAEPLGQLTHPPLETVYSGARSLVRLPGRIPRRPRLGTVLPGRVEHSLGRAETVGRRVVGFLRVLAGGVGILQCGLRGGQPAARVSTSETVSAPNPQSR